MFMVEIRDAYQSVTLHLRQPPRPGEKYALEIELARDEIELETRRLEFALVFLDPQAADTLGRQRTTEARRARTFSENSVFSVSPW